MLCVGRIVRKSHFDSSYENNMVTATENVCGWTRLFDNTDDILRSKIYEDPKIHYQRSHDDVILAQWNCRQINRKRYVNNGSNNSLAKKHIRYILPMQKVKLRRTKYEFPRSQNLCRIFGMKQLKYETKMQIFPAVVH